MPEKLTKLYNTLSLIETKGESTKHMAACLNYIQQLVAECSATANAPIVDTNKEGD
jgi:hypothetical protein